jgi:hypothetical protein
MRNPAVTIRADIFLLFAVMLLAAVVLAQR